MEDEDTKDTQKARKVAIAGGILVLLWLVAGPFALTSFGGVLAMAQEGLGWRDAAIISFLFCTTLIRELPSMIIGFLGLFVLLWVGLAYLF